MVYDPSKVADFYETCMNIGLTDKCEKNESYLCDWCEYKDYCQKGLDYMILPSAKEDRLERQPKENYGFMVVHFQEKQHLWIQHLHH